MTHRVSAAERGGNNLNGFEGLAAEIKDLVLVMTVLYVPSSLDSGTTVANVSRTSRWCFNHLTLNCKV